MLTLFHLYFSFNDLEELRQAGLYLADMNGHGLSKEMLLQGWQHLSRLELLFEKAESRCMSLEKSCRLRDQWKKRGDQLLYSMIPKPIADHLRAGKDPMGACQVGIPITNTGCPRSLKERISINYGIGCIYRVHVKTCNFSKVQSC